MSCVGGVEMKEEMFNILGWPEPGLVSDRLISHHETVAQFGYQPRASHLLFVECGLLPPSTMQNDVSHSHLECVGEEDAAFHCL